MLAELHSHSVYSHGKKVYVEGLDSPEQMVKYAARKGMGAIAITDHDVFKGSKESLKYGKKYNIITIPGIEITTENRGHVIALGIEEKIPSFLSVRETVDKIHEQNGIAMAPHPFDIGRFGVKKEVFYCGVYELFNSLSLEKASNRRAFRFQKKNKNFPVVSGSDAHCKEMIGYGAIEVKADNIDNILKKIKKGETEPRFNYVPEDVMLEWAIERLRRSYEYTLKYMEENYRYPKKLVYKKLLKLVRRDSFTTHFFIRIAAEMGLGIAKAYGALVELLRWRI